MGKPSDRLTGMQAVVTGVLVFAISWATTTFAGMFSDTRASREEIAQLQAWRLSAEQALRNCKP